MPAPRSTLDSASRHGVVYRDLSAKIRSGSLTPGQRLPAEIDLATQYGISRTSLRKGLERLRRQGLLVKRRGSGTYVAIDGNAPVPAQLTLCVRMSYDVFGHPEPWGKSIREALMHAAAAHRLSLMAEVAWPSAEHPMSPISSAHLAGVIALPVGTIRASELFAGVPDGVPRVVINRPSGDPSIPAVDVDLSAGVFDAVSHLLRLGHRHIALATHGDMPPDDQAIAGYRAAFQQARIAVDESRIGMLPSNAEHERWPEVVRRLLSARPRPTALLMNFIDHPLRILDAIRGEGLHVPRDLSLVLFDDDASLYETTPSISAVPQPIDRMAWAGVKALMDLRRGVKNVPSYQRLRSCFVVRESVGLPPG